ncbi:MAG: isocitrate/isopropylmalate dehydrogenase family protein [Gemmatimonadota bacterium]
MRRIAVLPGDGIGKEVVPAALKALAALEESSGIRYQTELFDYGADRYLASGVTLPEGQLEAFGAYDAILLGALGDPRVPDNAHARDILFGIRFGLDLYVNHRPIRLLHERLCPLKGKTPEDVDFVVLRENTEGAYVDVGGVFKRGTPDEVAVNEDVNTRKGVERILRHAFELARSSGRGKVAMADKSNALRHAHGLWLRAFEEVGAEYPDVERRHYYVDAIAMQMVRSPEEFEVIVTSNLFGDILTDLGAALQGGLGMAASANVHPGGAAMFEPVHGSAPPLAGRDVANPMGAILTCALMVEHLGDAAGGRLLEEAVRAALVEGVCTPDVGGTRGTSDVAEWITARVRRGAGRE